MDVIELKDVCFDYEASERQEQAEEEAERREKKHKKANKTNEDVFGELGGNPSSSDLAAQPEPDPGANEAGVLRHVSLAVAEGQFLALVGRNGSGKSTLAKLMNGLLLPVAGDVLVYGMNTRSKKSLYDIRKKVGVVFQNPDNQMIASIVEDDIAFGPENIGVPQAEIRERVDWALSAVGMSEFATSAASKLSGGQKQRIAIAGMLAVRPRVLVLDESTAMLDPRGRAEVMDVVRHLNREEGITVIHITHYMDEAACADRIVVLEEGRVAMDGTPAQVFADTARLFDAGLRLPSVMELAALLRNRGVAVPPGIFRAQELVEAICQSR